jgi:hypothetical protein
MDPQVVQVVELSMTNYRRNGNMMTAISNLDSRVLVIAVRLMTGVSMLRKFRNEFYGSRRITTLFIYKACEWQRKSCRVF